MKPKIKIADTQFAHTPGGSFGTGDLCIPPSHFDWYRGDETINNIIVVTESCFHQVDRYTESFKIALLIEPPLINTESYHWIRQECNYKTFNLILTYNKELLSIDSRFKWYPFGGCWIKPADQKIYEKTKRISIIASSKKITFGHRLRHDIINRFIDSIDVFGNGYQFIESKLTGLRDYAYSIVVENDPCDAFFSEKLIDCFRTGTVPIYWGSESVGKHFDTHGMCGFRDIDELSNILTNILNDTLRICPLSIIDNYETAAKYTIPENWLWDNVLSGHFS
ncbi:MAG TPA: hypothetical protein VEA58_11745 [Anaerovoracaceae bacterium]|nr:hypothetical protein [Anaerovoracaceae bacterium]